MALERRGFVSGAGDVMNESFMTPGKVNESFMTLSGRCSWRGRVVPAIAVMSRMTHWGPRRSPMSHSRPWVSGRRARLDFAGTLTPGEAARARRSWAGLGRAASEPTGVRSGTREAADQQV